MRFNETDIRVIGRNGRGVKGFNVDGGEVIGMATSNEGNLILTITENGYGKKSELSDYRLVGRGSKGVITVKVTEKTGNLVSMRAVNGDEDCLIVTDDGIIIRISLAQVSTFGRNSQGVKVINVNENSKVSRVAIVSKEETEEESDEN